MSEDTSYLERAKKWIESEPEREEVEQTVENLAHKLRTPGMPDNVAADFRAAQNLLNEYLRTGNAKAVEGFDVQQPNAGLGLDSSPLGEPPATQTQGSDRRERFQQLKQSLEAPEVGEASFSPADAGRSPQRVAVYPGGFLYMPKKTLAHFGIPTDSIEFVTLSDASNGMVAIKFGGDAKCGKTRRVTRNSTLFIRQALKTAGLKYNDTYEYTLTKMEIDGYKGEFLVLGGSTK